MKTYLVKAQIDLPNQVVLKRDTTLTEADIKAHDLAPEVIDALIASSCLVEMQPETKSATKTVS
jgi:hypothetical protein